MFHHVSFRHPSFRKGGFQNKKIHPFVDLKDLQPFLRSGETRVSTRTQQTPRLRVKVVAVPLELGMFLRLEVGRKGERAPVESGKGSFFVFLGQVWVNISNLFETRT